MTEPMYFIFDFAACSNYFNWFFSENSDIPERNALFKLHLISAMRVANEECPILVINNMISKELADAYQDRGLVLDTFLGASRCDTFSKEISVTDAVIKQASFYLFKGMQFYIVAGDTFVYEAAKKQGLEVIRLTELEATLLKHHIQ